MSETTSYQENRQVILNRANECYQNNKEALREKAETYLKEKKIKRENVEESDIILCLKKIHKD